RFHASRPTMQGLEIHLVAMHKIIRDYNPHVVILDPVTNLTAAGTTMEVKSALMRLIDHLKSLQITALLTSPTETASDIENSEACISSLMDRWLLVRMIETNGERNRGIYLLKPRGMAHAN